MQYTWEDIERFVNACSHCPLSRTRCRPVMGRGDHQADLMLIAEAPGRDEDRQGRPFVGRSGEVLDRLLRDCGLDREEIYMTNILKCHPPGNRDPKEEEKEACLPYLKYETYLRNQRSLSALAASLRGALFHRILKLPGSMASGHTAKSARSLRYTTLLRFCGILPSMKLRKRISKK